METYYDVNRYCHSVDRYLDSYSSFLKMVTLVKKHGLSRSMYYMINGEGELSESTGRHLPAMEDFHLYTPDEIVTIAQESFMDVLRSIWKAIRDFFAKIWNWIKGLFGDGSGSTPAEKKTESTEAAIENKAKKVDKSKLDEAMAKEHENLNMPNKSDYFENIKNLDILMNVVSRQLDRLIKVKLDPAKLKEGDLSDDDIIITPTKEETAAREHIHKVPEASSHKSLKEAGWSASSFDEAMAAWSKCKQNRKAFASKQREITNLYKQWGKLLDDACAEIEKDKNWFGGIKDKKGLKVINNLRTALKVLNTATRESFTPMIRMYGRINRDTYRLVTLVTSH